MRREVRNDVLHHDASVLDRQAQPDSSFRDRLLLKARFRIIESDVLLLNHDGSVLDRQGQPIPTLRNRILLEEAAGVTVHRENNHDASVLDRQAQQNPSLRDRLLLQAVVCYEITEVFFLMRPWGS